MDWHQVMDDTCISLEYMLDVKLVIDDDIVKEINLMAIRTLKQYQPVKPNAAKIAGHIAFWTRKLKPIFYDGDTKNKYLTINELAGVLIGFGVCFHFYNNSKIHPHGRWFEDWLKSLRFNSHSPQSTALFFEAFFTDE